MVLLFLYTKIAAVTQWHGASGLRVFAAAIQKRSWPFRLGVGFILSADLLEDSLQYRWVSIVQIGTHFFLCMKRI